MVLIFPVQRKGLRVGLTKASRHLIAALSLALGACATPVSYNNAPMHTYDKDTEYNVDERENGFVVTVYYSRYQFIPESDAVALACKQALTAIAHEVAERKGQRIEPVNEQRIRISMGRNGLSGITSCSATGPAIWLGQAPKAQP